MDVSIIIPTFNRKEVLRRTLLALEKQTYPPSKREIIVVDDGSIDGTAEMVQGLQFPDLIYTCQPNRGRASARNAGVRLARGDLFLFLDDDMEATPTLIEQHVASHLQHQGVIVRGQFRLPKEIELTCFARLMLEDAGHPAGIADEKGFLPFGQLLTGNLSLRAPDFRTVGFFDERFHKYGWEDVEFGYRASRAGLRILYNPLALAYHHDYALDLQSHSSRLRQGCRWAPLLFDLWPELESQIPMFQDKMPVRWDKDSPGLVCKKLVRRVISAPVLVGGLQRIIPLLERLTSSPWLLKRCYNIVIGANILWGYCEGLRQPSQPAASGSGL